MARTSILSRREWLRLAAAGVIGTSMSGWLDVIAAQTANDPRRKRSCILLWMSGGPSQMDTFDLKPGTANGGPFTEVETSAPGLRISQHLPQIAKFGDRMAVIRSMSTKEGDHGRATFLMRTGYLPQGPIQYPSLGAHVAHELGSDEAALPNAVAIAPYAALSPGAYGSGFLGPKYAPLMVGDVANPFQPQGQVDYDQALKVKDLAPPNEVSSAHADSRIDLLREMEKDFVARHPDVSPHSHLTAYDRAIRLMRTDAVKAFNIDEEKAGVRDRYGRNLFGQGCLLARRLVERGVPFVEVSLGSTPEVPVGWDTHGDNFNNVQKLSAILDPAWGALMTDLKERGLLDTTLIVWMGEFGRTPKINGRGQGAGRDHFPNAWSTVLAGGGIKGGQAYGKTSEDGSTVEQNPVSVPNFIATVCAALGIDPTKQNQSNVGRPIRIADAGAKPIQEVLA
jgi:hypothetical protein